MPDRPKHYDKEVYERAYKQSFQSLDRSRASSRPASAGAVGGVSTGTSAAQQKPAPRKEIDPRRVDPRTAVLDRQLINPGGIDSYPAALATVPHVKDSRPQNALHPTHKKKVRNSSPAKTEAWMDIFEKDDDLEVRTMRSMVPTPSPYFIPTPSPNAIPSATVPRDKLPHSSHRQDVTRLPGDRTRNLRTLDDRYAGKQRVRSSSDAPRPPKPSPAYYTPVHLIPPGEREPRTNNLRHTAQSSRDLRTSHPAPQSHREGRSRHTRSSSDQPKLTRDPPRDPPLTSLVHEVRDRHLSDMRAGSAGMPLHPSRQRAALPGQWTVDAKPPAPATNGRYDMRQAGVAKPHIYQEKAVPHTPNILLPLTVAEQAERSSRPRRHHGPPPSREAHGERHRPSSFDGGQHVDTRRKDRDRHLQTAVERPPERSDASRPTRAHEDEYRQARDKETRRQERRARRHTIDDDKSNLWLRESTFDPARLPPGNAPLPASYLPPKRPSRQSSRDSTRQQSHSRTMKESQQVPLSYPVQPGAHGYGPASGPSSHRAVPAQRHHAAPLHAPQPTAAFAQPHLHPHGPPQVFAGESRWREDFDAKTLSASVFSADTPRAQSAPPEDVTPAKGLGRKLRKRPPEQPTLSIDATLRPPPGPVSPTLQSPASGGSDKARFGSLPRVFMPHKWLGSKT